MAPARIRTVFQGLTMTAVIGLALGGCATPRDRSGMTSAYPLDRVRAAVACAEAGDAQAVDLLIELLNDHDRAVRMYSILALKRLCGDDYGYLYYASDAQRGVAIDRWRTARARGEVTLNSPARESSAANPAIGQSTTKGGTPTP